jgi:glucose uptake protein GlcU
MGLIFSFLATLFESVGKTVDKLNYHRTGITYRQMLLLTFFGMALLLLVFVLLIRQPFPRVSPVSFSLIILIILFSFGGNVYDEISLRSDDLSLREPMVDFQPILAGLVGYAFFPAERKPIFLLAFIASAFIVYWGTHRRKLRHLQAKGMLYLLLAAALYAFLPSIYKVALNYFSPAYISFLRCAAIVLLLAIFLPVRNVTKLSSSKVVYSSWSALFYAAEAIVSLYAIQSLGVVLTMLILMLGPVLRYLSSYFILREKVRMGEVVASFLLAVVVFVSLVH